MDSSTLQEYLSENIVWAIVIFVVGSLALYSLFGRIVFDFLGAVGSLILSLLLVNLYFSQTNIMGSQKDFQESIERPVVHVEGYNNSNRSKYLGKEKRTLKLLLTNAGRASARNIEIRLTPCFPLKDQEPRYILEPSRSQVNRVGTDHSDWFSDTGTYLLSSSQKIEYYAPFSHVFKLNSDNRERNILFDELYGRLDLECEKIRMKGDIIHEGPNGVYEEGIFDRVIDVREDELALAIHEGKPVSENDKERYPCV